MHFALWYGIISYIYDAYFINLVINFSGNWWKRKSILKYFFRFNWNIVKSRKILWNLTKKAVLFRIIVLIFSLEKPRYLENCVVREPCKWRTACIYIFFFQNFFSNLEIQLKINHNSSNLEQMFWAEINTKCSTVHFATNIFMIEEER